MISPKCPIAIPTYKNRPNNLVQNLDKVSENQIYVFCYKDDYENYKQYDCRPNVTFVKLDVPWRSIQKKRAFIQNYFVERPEIERYIMIDDDIVKFRMKKEDGKVSNVSINEGLAYLDSMHTKYCKTMSGCEVSSAAMSHAIKDFTYSKLFTAVFCFENKWVIEHPECRFKDFKNISEDMVIFFDCKKNNQPFVSFSKICFIENSRKENYHIASSFENVIKNVVNAIRYMKEYTVVKMFPYRTKEFNRVMISTCIDKDLHINEKYYSIYKPILDKYMSGWENLNNEYDFSIVDKVFTEIADEELKLFKIPKKKCFAILKDYKDKLTKNNSCLEDFYE